MASRTCKCPRGTKKVRVGKGGIRCQRKNGRFAKTPKACTKPSGRGRRKTTTRRRSRRGEVCRDRDGRFASCRGMSSHQRTMMAARRSPGWFGEVW
jgi:hypothetical protein